MERSSFSRAVPGCLIAAFVLVGLTGQAWAQSDDDRARFHFQAGRSYYEQGRYEDAVREWQESFQLSGRPLLLRNIAEAQERLFLFDEAIASLEQYLRDGAEEAESNRTTVLSRIGRLRQQAEEYQGHVAGGTGTRPPGDDPEGTSPGDGGGGDPGVGATGTGDGAGDGAGDGGGGTEPHEAPPRRAGWTWAWVGLGATGLFAITGMITGIVAMGIQSDLEDLCPNQICPADLRDDRDRGHSLALTTDVMLGLAGAAAIATVVLFFLEPRPELPAQATLSPWFGRRSAGLAGTLRF